MTDCKHENLSTEMEMRDGKIIKVSTRCDDCGKKLT